MQMIMEPKIGIEKKSINTSIKNLTIVLSNEMVLYVKTRKFHWNVSGKSFIELHKLFESQYKNMEAIIDEVAERISKLGGEAIGSMKEFTTHSILKESLTIPTQENMISELLKDHEATISNLRNMIETMEDTGNDFGTIDFLTAVMQKHESMAWILRKYIS
jgi:starvation-inducible DNA-binding protein